MFEGPTTKKVLRYIEKTYGGEPEFLWAKYPGNAVFRHRENKKWYAALLCIPKRKLGLMEKGEADILDLKCDSRMIGSLLDGKGYFPGYHMNKEHWITLLLDGSIPEKELFGMIDLSYQMTKGRGRGASPAVEKERGQTDE